MEEILMAKSFKKVIACLLVVLMVCMSIPFTAFAATTTVFKYHPGDYHPDVTVQFGTIVDESADNAWVTSGSTSEITEISTKNTLSVAGQSGIGGPQLKAEGSIDKTTGVYSVSSLTLEASDTTELADYYDLDAAESDYQLKKGDLVTVTVCMDLQETTGVFSDAVYLQYSDNLVPAGLYQVGSKKADRVIYAATEEQYNENADDAVDEVGFRQPYAASSAKALYVNMDSTFGDKSEILTDNDGVSYLKIWNTTGTGETIDVSKINNISADSDGVFPVTYEDGSLGNYYDQGAYVMETFVFMLAEDISDENTIDIQMYDPDNTKCGGFNGGYYYYYRQEGMNYNWTTYAKNNIYYDDNPDGNENPGSTLMTFFGTNVNVVSDVEEHDHSANTQLDEDSVVVANCTTKGFTGNIVCVDDGEIVTAGTETAIDPDNHDYKFSKTVQPTHTAEGYDLYVCSRCGAELKSNYVNATGHTPGEAQKENVVPATCTQEGSYDLVVRCTEDDAIISSTPGKSEKIAHTPAAAVKENEVPATEEAAGSYDEVVYCSVCGEELSRETKPITQLAHTHKYTETYTAPTCTTNGYTTKTCTSGDDVQVIEDSPATTLQHSYTKVVSAEVPATKTTDGKTAVMECVNGCGEQIGGEVIPALGFTLTVDGTYAQYGNVTGAAYGDNNVKNNTSVTLTAETLEGVDFVGWSVSGKQVTTNPTYTFTVTSDITVTPIFAPASANTITVVFLDKYNNVTYSFTGSASDFAAEMAKAIPSGTNYPGYTFDSWELTDDQILAINESTTVKANYTAVAKTYTVTLDGTGTIDGEAVTEKSVPYDTAVTVKSEGATAWEVNGVKVAYGDTYKFYVGADITVTPVTDNSIEAQPEVSIINATVSDAANKKVNYLATMSLPEDYQVVDHGFIYVADKTDADTLTLENVGGKAQNGKVIKKGTLGTDGAKQFALNYAVKTTQYGTVIAYVVYQDKDGKTDVTYSAPVVFDYSTIA
jgi:hypothetical protein